MWPQGVSWLKPTALPESRPTRPASKWPHGLPDTYRQIQSSGMFRASAWGKRQERSPQALRLGAELRSGGSTWSPGSRVPSLPAARPAGPRGLPCRGWISPGLSELHRHQGEAALGYQQPGEHRRQNKHRSRSSIGPLPAAGNNYKVTGQFLKALQKGGCGPKGRPLCNPFPSSCCCSTLQDQATLPPAPLGKPRKARLEVTEEMG